jgi:hypothetical protein
MAELMVRFHATPAELADWLQVLMAGGGVSVTAVRFGPFGVAPVGAADLADVLADGRVRRLAVTPGQPLLAVERHSGFLAANPAALLIDVGRREPAGLRETWLTARTPEAAAMRRWRDFAATVQAATEPTSHPDSPTTRRCTPAAAALAAHGVALLPVAGPAADPTAGPATGPALMTDCLPAPGPARPHRQVQV